MTFRAIQFVMPLLSLILLVVVGLDLESERVSSVDTSPYHRQVREAVASIPNEFGINWIGRDQEMLPQAVDLLKPNASLLRTYHNMQNGAEFGLMIFQSGDARDMGGHFPPVCYPANGWEPIPDSQVARSWTLNDQDLPGMEYAFEMETSSGTSRIVIHCLLLLPDGRAVREMGPVRQFGGNHSKKAYGAAQIQLIYDQSLDPHVRDQITQWVLLLNRPVIELLLSGAIDES